MNGLTKHSKIIIEKSYLENLQRDEKTIRLLNAVSMALLLGAIFFVALSL